MTDTPLPERKIPDEKIEEYRDFYVELLGFVPPRIQARTDLLAHVDPDLLSMQEEFTTPLHVSRLLRRKNFSVDPVCNSPRKPAGRGEAPCLGCVSCRSNL